MSNDFDFLKHRIIGVVLGGLFYGVYCVIFGLYLKIKLKRRDGFKGLLTYALSLNFILCTVFLAIYISYLLKLYQISCQSYPDLASTDFLLLGGSLVYFCIDLISQGILIYRCWILWRRPLIVVVPVILSLGYLAISSLALFAYYSYVHTGVLPTWDNPILISGFFISTVMNGLVTGLIVTKIIMKLKASGARQLRVVSRDLYLVIWTLVESGTITFLGQLLQIIMWMVGPPFTYLIFSDILPMFFGISPTLILVRLGMGHAYDTEVFGMTTPHAIQLAGVGSSSDRTAQVTTGNNSKDNLRISGSDSTKT